MMDAKNAHLSVRISESDKNKLTEVAAQSGVDASVAVRQVIEMMVRRFERGGDYWDAMYELKSAWQPQHGDAKRLMQLLQDSLEALPIERSASQGQPSDPDVAPAHARRVSGL